MDVLDPPIVIINNIPEPTGCLNKNVYSSMLFILPIIYSYILLPYSPVMFGSIACLLTSVIHHYYKAENKYLRIIDRITVNSIAGYSTINCIINIGNKFYANIMYFFAFLALALWAYIFKNPNLYCDYYCLVHILAVTGVLFYIKSLKTYLEPKEDIKEVVDNSIPITNEDLGKIT